MRRSARSLRIAFVVGDFPVATETFIINQVADLLERGVDVEIFALGGRPGADISDRYNQYRMGERTHYLELPSGRIRMLALALPKILKFMVLNPSALFRLLFSDQSDAKQTYRSRLLFDSSAFLGKSFDLVHCHFGPVAVRYLETRRVLRHVAKLVTTFYGYDVSRVFKSMPPDYYDELKRTGSLFFVMSDDMKRRVVSAGFSEEKVVVLPVSIDVRSYPYSPRAAAPGETVNIVSVGRFVEKKGFDDIIRAVSLVKERTKDPFKVTLIGGGPEESKLKELVSAKGLNDCVEFKPPMAVERIVQSFMTMHLFVQPSQTAADGEME